MQPSKRPPTKPRAVRAVRAEIAKSLAWLNGCPLEPDADSIRWLTIPDPKHNQRFDIISVDRSTIRSSVYAVHKIKRQFPRALKQVVGSVSSWEQSVFQRLECLKAVLHKQQELPTLDQLVAWHRLPILKASPSPLITAAFWLLWGQRRALKKAVKQLQRFPKAFALLMSSSPAPAHSSSPLARSLKALLLALTHTHLVNPLFQLLQHHAHHDCPLDWKAIRHDLDRLRQEASKQLQQQNESTAIGVSLQWPNDFELNFWIAPVLQLTEQLWALDRSSVRAAVWLLRNLLTDHRLFSAATKWQDLQALRRSLETHNALPESAHQRRHLLESIDLQAQNLLHNRLERVTPDTLSTLRQFASLKCPYKDDILRLLKTLSGFDQSTSTITGILEMWHVEDLGRRHDQAMQRLLRELTSLVKIAAQHGQGHAMARWMSHNLVGEMLDKYCDLDESEEHMVKLFKALKTLAAGQTCAGQWGFFEDFEGWRLFNSLLDSGWPVSQAFLTQRALCAPEFRAFSHAMRVWACSLAPTDIELTKQTLLTLPKDRRPFSHDALVARLCQSPAIRECLRRALLGGAHTQVFQALDDFQCLSELNHWKARQVCAQWPCVQTPSKPAPTLEYLPRALADLVEQLHTLDLPVEKVVRNCIGHIFPCPEDLRREITALEAKLSEPGPSPEHLQRRLSRLRQRLTHSHRFKQADVAKARSRLQAATARRHITWVSAQLRRRLEQSLTQRSPNIDWADLFNAHDATMILAGCGLSAKSRALFFEVLKRGHEPQSLLSFASNQRFIEAMDKLDLKLSPWLFETLERSVTDSQGRRLQLRLERDVFEILKMGQYFGTCLSFGAMHFSTALANAIDANKQVLFVRDESGCVEARCLLALNSAGGLLCYHRYSHSRDPVVLDAMSEFARILAEAMGANLSTTGCVEHLVSPEWIDDGPREHAAELSWCELSSILDSAQGGLSPALADCYKALFGDGLKALMALDEVLERLNAGSHGLESLTDFATELLSQTQGRDPKRRLKRLLRVCGMRIEHGWRPEPELLGEVLWQPLRAFEGLEVTDFLRLMAVYEQQQRHHNASRLYKRWQRSGRLAGLDAEIHRSLRARVLGHSEKDR